MIALALALAVMEPPPEQALLVRPAEEDVQACTELRKVVVATTAGLPRWVDAVTRVDALSVTCDSKTYQVSKLITQPLSAMQEGWQGRKQAQWNESMCKGDMASLLKRGWRISQVITFASGERIEIAAHCAT